MPGESAIDPPEALARRKERLRRQMREARARVPVERRVAFAERVASHLFRLPELTEARTVMVFYSFGAEIPTGVLIRRLLWEGRRVLLPFLDEEGAMEAGELLPEDVPLVTAYGPKEPPRRSPIDPAEVDIVITPGLAFDPAGHRLGYGGAHYDRFLARLPGRTPRIAIGYSLQLLDDVPAGSHDQLVDVVVTEEGVTRRRTA